MEKQRADGGEKKLITATKPEDKFAVLHKKEGEKKRRTKRKKKGTTARNVHGNSRHDQGYQSEK